ncbi:hypothetical protein [Acidiplasma cupricumulans]|uniref:Uncharacterized protein n=2 Tax=Acidiplasma cupricumulans TaxID=312540 RepID=A0A0Q0XKI2_9ARCH|nr:hypothetical protein [Acidiplasma cupricumulans]KQB35629.1 hypothetical protein AOG55_06180 [Acidiplasma cupricumulans]
MSQKIKCKYGRIIIGDLIKEDSVKKIKEIFKISDLEFNKKYTVNIKDLLNNAHNYPLSPTTKARALFDYIGKTYIAIIYYKEDVTKLSLPAIILETELDINIINKRINKGLENDITNLSGYIGEVLQINFDIISKDIYNHPPNKFNPSSYVILDLSFYTDKKSFFDLNNKIQKVRQSDKSLLSSTDYEKLIKLEPVNFKNKAEDHHSVISYNNSLVFRGLNTLIIDDPRPLIYQYTLDYTVFTSVNVLIRPLLSIPEKNFIDNPNEWPANILFAELMILFAKYTDYLQKSAIKEVDNLNLGNELQKTELKKLFQMVTEKLYALSNNVNSLELFNNENEESINKIIDNNIPFKGPELIYEYTGTIVGESIYFGKYKNFNVTQLIFKMLTENINYAVKANRTAVEYIDNINRITIAKLNFENAKTTEKSTKFLLIATGILVILTAALLILPLFKH